MIVNRLFLMFSLLLLSATAIAAHHADIPATTSSEEAKMLYIAGMAAADLGNGVEANRLFRAAVEADPKFARGWLEVANNALSGDEFTAAMQQAHALAADVSEGEALLIEINMRFMDNDFERQKTLANKLVETHPGSARAWLTHGNVHTGLNESEQARKSITKAIELDGGFVPAYVALGNSYLFNEPKNMPKAEKIFKKAIALQPGEDNHYWGLGDVYRAMTDLERAARLYEVATMLDPNNATAFTKAGHVHSFLGNYDQARENYEQALRVSQPAQKAFLANYKYFTWVHANDPKTGVEGLESLYDEIQAMELPDQHKTGAMIFTLTNAAMICMDKGMHEHAEKLIEMRASLLRQNAEAVGTPEFANIQEANIAFFKGQAAARRGDLRAARKWARENMALVKDEDNPRKMEQYHQLMGLINLQDNKHEKAVTHLRQADHLNNIYVKYHLALALEGAGEKDEAKKLFNEVADWNFNSAGYALVRESAMKHGGA